MKVRQVGAEFLHADGRIDIATSIHDKTNRQLYNFAQSTLKLGYTGFSMNENFAFQGVVTVARYVFTGTKNYTENKIELNPSFDL